MYCTTWQDDGFQLALSSATSINSQLPPPHDRKQMEAWKPKPLFLHVLFCPSKHRLPYYHQARQQCHLLIVGSPRNRPRRAKSRPREMVASFRDFRQINPKQARHAQFFSHLTSCRNGTKITSTFAMAIAQSQARLRFLSTVGPIFTTSRETYIPT